MNKLLIWVQLYKAKIIFGTKFMIYNMCVLFSLFL